MKDMAEEDGEESGEGGRKEESISGQRGDSRTMADRAVTCSVISLPQ